jgi:hypothetical protein
VTLTVAVLVFPWESVAVTVIKPPAVAGVEGAVKVLELSDPFVAEKVTSPVPPVVLKISVPPGKMFKKLGLIANAAVTVIAVEHAGVRPEAEAPM